MGSQTATVPPLPAQKSENESKTLSTPPISRPISRATAGGQIVVDMGALRERAAAKRVYSLAAKIVHLSKKHEGPAQRPGAGRRKEER